MEGSNRVDYDMRVLTDPGQISAAAWNGLVQQLPIKILIALLRLLFNNQLPSSFRSFTAAALTFLAYCVILYAYLRTHMPNPSYQRFAISIPAPMATQIEEACKREGRNRSEFFREAVRFYINAGRASPPPQWVMPNNEEDQNHDPFRLFTEWNSAADSVYDCLR
jgi:hypothetical protein